MGDIVFGIRVDLESAIPCQPAKTKILSRVLPGLRVEFKIEEVVQVHVLHHALGGEDVFLDPKMGLLLDDLFEHMSPDHHESGRTMFAFYPRIINEFGFLLLPDRVFVT